MSIVNINPDSLYDGSPFSLSQAKVDTVSGLIFVSGQVDWGRDYEVINKTIEAQTENVAKNLLTVLEESSSAVEYLLHLRIYIRGELANHMPKVVPIIAKYLGAARPAITGIGVASLATPDTLIEIEAVAKILT
ncbi:Rid family hydrolase [Microbulbifer sp. OS29]|uniref:Rid family hydrolase n=1 Tax=Microbulbifer okhotskensis TaxID=2926617 RepID=A0A9X2EPN2_9GAMM|nr:Rid family hydrolase [Microbulbifer okhotskensis]MCO1335030.1 Rid family hydrolase [Microbulbifer okhotskensis]